jgi:DNA-binding GntR family transcriptional regulator
VTGLDIDDVRDIYKVRVLIECAAFREAVQNADVEYEARVVASHHRMSRTPVLTDDATPALSEEWARAHQEFHRALISACASPRLRELADSLRETTELYRRWSDSLSAQQEPRDVPAEHRALMEAALDRDADRAVALLTEHINKTASLLERYVETRRAQLGAVPDAGADAEAG